MRQSVLAPAVVAALLVAACAATSSLAPAPGAERPTQVETTPSATPDEAATSGLPDEPAPPANRARTQASSLRGKVSLYGEAFAGKKTANGDTFDPQALTMAHRTLPFGTRVRVTNLANHRSVEVVVNDRGPMVPGRVADLSLEAARRIGMVANGVVDALLEIVAPAPAR